jgi:predicted HicB family RNase H-like nuclease
MHKESDRYLKIVEWSDEDQVYVGTCPGLFLGGVHGKDETKVYRELCQVVDEWIKTIKKDGKTLPPSTNKQNYSGKFILRVGSELHRALHLRALQVGDSLNNFCTKILHKTVLG